MKCRAVSDYTPTARGTGVPRPKEMAPPRKDPTEGLCPGPYGGPRGVGVFWWAKYPYLGTCPEVKTDGTAHKGLLRLSLRTMARLRPLQGYLALKKTPPLQTTVGP